MTPEPFDLVVDVGNSRSKLALFQGAKVIRAGVFNDFNLDVISTFIDDLPVRAVALGSVARPDPELEELLNARFRTFRLTGQSPSPLRVVYDTPATLGVDRLANAVAASSMFPSRSVVAIDIGSCITYDLVTALHGFEGGIISPGPGIRARAMHAYSARLPLVDPAPDVPLIGRSTATALSAGVFHGVRYEILGLVEALRQQVDDLAVVLTGGGAVPYIRTLKIGIFADPLLTLRGLHALLLHQIPIARGAGAGPSVGLASDPSAGK